jgi:hypothetical protein
MQPDLLRPKRIGELLDTSIRMYRTQVAALLGFTCLVLLPVMAVRLLLLSNPTLLQVVTLGQALLINPLLTSALTIASLHIYDQQSIAPIQLLQAGARRYFAVFGAAILLWLIVALPAGLIAGCLVFAILASSQSAPIAVGLMFLVMLPFIVFIGVRYSMIYPAVIIENLGPSMALRRSWALTKGKFWHVAGTIFTASLLTALVAQAPSLTVAYLSLRTPGIAVPTWWLAVQLLVEQLGLIIVLPLQYLVPVVLYYDLRIRNEGYDLERATETVSAPSPLA